MTRTRALEDVSRLGAAISAVTPMLREEVLLEALRRVAVDGYVSVPRYVDASSGVASLPCAATIIARFGSWNTAVARAGLQHGPTRRRTYTRITPERMVADIARAADELGIRLPSVADYARVKRENPEWGLTCDALIRRRLGSWPTALKLACERTAETGTDA